MLAPSSSVMHFVSFLIMMRCSALGVKRFKVYADQTVKLLKLTHIFYIFCPSIPDIMLKINSINLEGQMRLKQKMC